MSQQAAFSDTESTQLAPKPSVTKSHVLFSSTVRAPPHAYARLGLIFDGPKLPKLDNLQVRSYLTAALRQFMGDHGAAVAIDILKVDGKECWVRLPRQDLSLLAAAITAYPGITMGGSGGTGVLRMLACGDWLGSLVGRDGEEMMWV
jgi:ribonuclease P/MRP protein subunit POP8